MWAIFWPAHGQFTLFTSCCRLGPIPKGLILSSIPVVRGTGPLFTVIWCLSDFRESFTGVQWLGVGVLVAGIFGLALYNFVYLVSERDTLNAALGLAVLTGLFVALYTTF